MFNKPIKHVRLKSVEELKMFSYHNDGVKRKPKTCFNHNGDIFFCDEYQQVWVTPFRSEIYSILKEAGYEEDTILIPYPNSEEVRETYAWLRKIANEENWAETYEKAFEVANEKGIKPVVLEQKVQVKEINGEYKDSQRRYYSMTSRFLCEYSIKNIGTYILLDNKSILVCDEYGRTFLIVVKTYINDVVNTLIEAGYTRTLNPEIYVKDRRIIESKI